MIDRIGKTPWKYQLPNRHVVLGPRIPVMSRMTLSGPNPSAIQAILKQMSQHTLKLLPIQDRYSNPSTEGCTLHSRMKCYRNRIHILSAVARIPRSSSEASDFTPILRRGVEARRYAGNLFTGPLFCRRLGAGVSSHQRRRLVCRNCRPPEDCRAVLDLTSAQHSTRLNVSSIFFPRSLEPDELALSGILDRRTNDRRDQSCQSDCSLSCKQAS